MPARPALRMDDLSHQAALAERNRSAAARQPATARDSVGQTRRTRRLPGRLATPAQTRLDVQLTAPPGGENTGNFNV